MLCISKPFCYAVCDIATALGYVMLFEFAKVVLTGLTGSKSHAMSPALCLVMQALW